MLPEDPDLLSRGHYRRLFMARPKASRRLRPVISVSDYLRAAYAPTPYVSVLAGIMTAQGHGPVNAPAEARPD